MNAFIDRHPLLARALPSPAHSPLGQHLRRPVESGTPESGANGQAPLSVKHASFSEMMFTARRDGGQLIHDQLATCGPKPVRMTLPWRRAWESRCGLGICCCVCAKTRRMVIFFCRRT